MVGKNPNIWDQIFWEGPTGVCGGHYSEVMGGCSGGQNILRGRVPTPYINILSLCSCMYVSAPCLLLPSGPAPGSCEFNLKLYCYRHSRQFMRA